MAYLGFSFIQVYLVCFIESLFNCLDGITGVEVGSNDFLVDVGGGKGGRIFTRMAVVHAVKG